MDAPTKLRTLDDLQGAHEWLFEQQRLGKLDAKAVDGLNTTLKGSTYLNVTVHMKLYELQIKAQMKKIALPPPVFLPQGLRPKA